MVVLSRRRLLYVFVITLIIATLCLWLGWRGNESSLRPKWRNVLSSSSSMSHLAQTRPWAKRLESVRQLMSLNRLEDTQPGKKTSKLDTGNGHHVFGDLWTATGNHMDMKERDYEDGEVLINENKVTSEISKNSNESQAIMTEGTVLSYNNADSVTNGVASEVRNQELESSSLNMLARMGITNQLKNGMESMLPVLPSKDNLIRKVVNFTSSKVKDFIKDIPPPTNLPWNKKQLLVSSKGIYERPWVQNLQHFLQYSYDPAYPVTLVSTNQLFVESVINWLIHSLVVLESPLKNVLVLTMDEGVYDFLKNRNINTVCVPAANNVKIDKPKKMFLMVRVEAARLLVLRMLNHWGIDVINYDNDAIVLKNPQPLLDALGRYDVIGSEGFMPYEVHERWGVTLCFGYFLLRATPATSESHYRYTHSFRCSNTCIFGGG